MAVLWSSAFHLLMGRMVSSLACFLQRMVVKLVWSQVFLLQMMVVKLVWSSASLLQRMSLVWRMKMNLKVSL